MAVVASATPNATPAKAQNHPPYKEMIVRAIQSLKERKGSSKKAIAKYIASNYNNLPPKHNALLSHHLGRLKKEVILQMIGKSYKLSNSGEALHIVNNNVTGLPRKRGRPRRIPTQEGVVSQSEKKKPGQPRKKLSATELLLPRTMKSMGMVGKRKRGRPRKGSSPVKQKPIVENTLGEKRKRSRPKKLASASALGEEKKQGWPKKLASALPLGENKKLDQPKKLSSDSVSVEKRKPGRPKKENRKPGRPKKESSTLKLASASVPGEKRKPGRPPKSGSIPIKPKISTVLASGEKRKRGRPRKESLSAQLAAASVSGERRKRGRPKKVPAAIGDGATNSVPAEVVVLNTEYNG